MTALTRSANQRNHSKPPASRGRRLAGLSIPMLLLGLSAAGAEPPQSPSYKHSPYSPSRHNPGFEPYRSPYGRESQTEGTRRGPPTGLRLQAGTTLSLTFGHDRYQDGATLAAIVQGLETGERLMIERTETGVLLRRHGGPPGSAYDFLEFD